MLLDRRLQEAARQTALGAAAGLQVEEGPADVVLLGPERDLLLRVGGGKAVVAPRARELSREPCMRELADRQRSVLLPAHEHAASLAAGAGQPPSALRSSSFSRSSVFTFSSASTRFCSLAGACVTVLLVTVVTFGTVFVLVDVTVCVTAGPLATVFVGALLCPIR